MSSFFTKAFDQLMGKKEARVLFMGLDAAGKTTILYKLKLGKVVTTIPTIGFNVEEIKYKNTTFTAWDVGGKDKILPLYRHYYHNTQVIVFVIDSVDRERLDVYDPNHWYDGVQHLLDSMATEDELKDAIFLFYANKQDLPNAMTAQEIESKLKLKALLGNRSYHIQPSCATTGDGLYEGLDWIIQTLQKSHKQIQQERQERKLIEMNKMKTVLLVSGYIRTIDSKYTFLTGHIPSSVCQLIHLFYKPPNENFHEYKYYGDYSTSTKSELLPYFLQRKYNDMQYIKDDDVFISTIKENEKLHIWSKQDWKNHFDFMRMIWILLIKHGRRTGLTLILKFTPYNTTKTYFWTQMIHFCLNNYSNKEQLKLIEAEFEYFLMLNPHLCNNYNELIKEYYSSKLLKIIDDEKKNEMVLSDLKQIPSIISDINKKKLDLNEEQKHDMSNNDDDDNLFINSFENRTYKSWSGHRSFLRIIWCYVDKWDGKKGCVKKTREELKRFQKDNYHETITYFWVHLIRYWRVLFKEYVANNININQWNFNLFIEFCEQNGKQCKMLNDEWWKEFYDVDIIYNKAFHNIDASVKMVLPNKKHLPQLKIISKQQ